MSKFWMMGVAAIAVAVAVVALDSRPVRSSEDLLAKAQSEFAIKARDALAQRRMVQTSTAPTSASAPPSVPQSPYKVASLEPVAPPTIAVSQAIVLPVAPVPPTATTDSPEAPVASPKLPASPEPPAATKTEDRETTEPQVVSTPGSPAAEDGVTAKPAPTVAVTPELTTVTAHGLAPTGSARRESAKATRKVQRASNPAKTRAVVRRSEPYPSRYSMPYGIEALRARAPEIAAAIARYM
jgi:hypothetical protein